MRSSDCDKSDRGIPPDCARMIALNLCPVENPDLQVVDARSRTWDHWLWPVISMTALLIALVASADDLLHHMTP